MDSTNSPAKAPRKPLSAKWTYIVLGLTLAFVLMPFLFWRATWFGRPLTDAQLAQALHGVGGPHDIQHGLSSVADRIIRNDPSVKKFYPQVIALAANPSPEIRTMSAWVMGQDNTARDFHPVLLHLLNDSNPMVQRNAALALVRFHDASGHAVIVSMLKATVVAAPYSGVLKTRLRAGQTLNPGTLIAHVEAQNGSREVRSEVPGTLNRWLMNDGANVSASQPIAAIFPSDDAVWESLRALYLIGTPEDLDAIAPYARQSEDVTPRIAEQARLTMRQIRAHANASSSAPTASPAPQ
ncbi:MAG: HEAT repeat domain-containing protein [Candidatus Acidiferrales bacterium]